MRQKTKVLVGSMIGNMLEFYDFTLYGVFAPLIALKFFPSESPLAALLATLMAYAVGFFVRPLGALLFGHMGDRVGRKTALTWSILGMAAPTLFIGLLPGYETIGFMAPVLVFVFRIFQGLCTGAEFNGAIIFLIEHTGATRGPGFAGSLASVSGAAGSLLASFIGAFLLWDIFPEWAWRLAFVLGSFVALAGFYIRRQVGESPAFLEAVSHQENAPRMPILEVFTKYPAQLFYTFLGSGFVGILALTFIVYMNVYLTKVIHVEMSHSLWFNAFGLFVFTVFCPLFGALADRYTYKRILLFGVWGILFGAFPIFFLAKTGDWQNILVAQFFLCFFSAAFIAPFNSYMTLLFPVSSRYSGSAFGYNLGVAALGSTTPIIATLFIEYTGILVSPAIYLSLGAALGGVAVLCSRRIPLMK